MTTETRSFATFVMNEQLFGMDILFVREVNRQLDLTPVPQAPTYFQGLMNLRGQIVTVVDLKKRLNLGFCRHSSETHNIIIKTEPELMDLKNRGELDLDYAIPDKVGLLVEGIGDVITVESEKITPPPANIAGLDKKYLDGIITLPTGLVILLNMKEVLNVNE